MKHEDVVLLLLSSGARRIPNDAPQFVWLNEDAQAQGYTLLVSVDGTIIAVTPTGEIKPVLVVPKQPEKEAA